MDEKPTANDTSYRFSAAEGWQRIPVIEWTPRKDGRKWAPVGFELMASQKWGKDYGITVEIRRPEGDTAPDVSRRVPLLATVEIADGLSYDVLCEDLPDALHLLRLVLPLIEADERQWEAERRDEHFGGNGHIAERSFSNYCEYCLANREISEAHKPW